MTALFLVALLIWSAVLIYALPGALAAFGRSPRHGDPMRAGVAVVAIVFLCGSLLRLFAVTDETIIAGLFVAVIGTGLFVMWLMKTYGRGGHA